MANMLKLYFTSSGQVVEVPYQAEVTINEVLIVSAAKLPSSTQVRLLHNGRVLYQRLRSQTLHEAGIQAGATVTAINQQNKLLEQIIKLKKPAPAEIGPTAKDASAGESAYRRLIMKFRGEQQPKEQVSEKPEEIQEIQSVSAELIAKITGAKNPAKQRVGRGDLNDSDHVSRLSAIQRMIYEISRGHDPGAVNSDSDEDQQQNQPINAEQIFRERMASIFSRVRPPAQEQQPVVPAQQSVQNLVEMGFPEESAKLVLTHFRNNFEMAMDYMMNTPEENDAALRPAASNSSAIGRPGQQPQQAQFVADPEALQTLQEMGYEEEACKYALRITSNNLEHACTYLLSNPNPQLSVLQNGIPEGDEMEMLRQRRLQLLQQTAALSDQLNRIQGPMHAMMEAARRRGNQ